MQFLVISLELSIWSLQFGVFSLQFSVWSGQGKFRGTVIKWLQCDHQKILSERKLHKAPPA